MAQNFPTIFEWAGGRDALESWLGRFYDLVEDDELLGPSLAAPSASSTGATLSPGGPR
jgi:truncated hemoglobin YjbI